LIVLVNKKKGGASRESKWSIRIRRGVLRGLACLLHKEALTFRSMSV